MNVSIRHLKRRRYRWAAAGAGMILMPIASHAANHTGWHAVVQAPIDADRAMASRSGPSPYADVWRQGILGSIDSIATGNVSVSLPATQQPVGTLSSWHGFAHGAQAAPDTQAPPVERDADARSRVRANEQDRFDSVTPQLAHSLATSTALMAYSSQSVDGLHERLGEIRNVMPTKDVGGDVFVRYSGGQLNYAARDRSRDFGQRADALQLGGAVAFWNEEGSSSRLGLAVDRGTVRISPEAAGASHVTYRATGFSAWYTRQQDTGGYLDAVLSGTRFKGGAEADPVLSGDIKANQWIASVEVGQPMMASENVSVEPQAQLKHQSLKIASITDADGSIVQGGRSRQTTARVGVRIAKVDNERFVPYVRVDVSRVLRGGSSKVSVRAPGDGMAKTSQSERPGASFGVSAGMTIKVNRTVDFYADAKTQGRIGGHGQSGLSANAGVRISF